MENQEIQTEAPAQVTVVPAEEKEYDFTYEAVEQTFQRNLFPTFFNSYTCPDIEKIRLDLIGLLDSSGKSEEDYVHDVMMLDHPAVNRLKQIIYEICDSLPIFSGENARNPIINSSTAFFQQKYEHVPLHAYEFTPLIFTVVLNVGEQAPSTYYADTRGAIQTIRQNVSQNLVGTSFAFKSRIGEIQVSPGYVQRYIETNLDDYTHVALNVLVGFANF